MDHLLQLFVSNGFMPNGFRHFRDAPLVWVHFVSEGLIALAYFTILIVLLWFLRKRRDLPFAWIVVLFGVFLVACGSTHVMEMWSLWHADSWLSGVVKAVAAAASVSTVISMAYLVPRALELPNYNEWTRRAALLETEIHDRREAELHLRISEANYREQAELLELTHDAIFVRSLGSKIVYWNRGAERLYGWEKNEARGKASYELLQTQFPKPRAEIETEVFEKGIWEGELTQRRRDGTLVIVSSRWALRTDPAGNPVAILESNRDITLRRIQENKFRDLLESAPDAILIADGAGRIQLVNAQTEKLFAYSREEMVGQPVELLVPHRFRARHAEHRHGYSQAPHARAMGVGLELFGRRKDGTEFPVEISLSPLQTEEGTLISSAIRDVTEHRRAETEIRSLNAELNSKLAQLGAVNQELESFSYSVSHDLRAPLRHIDGFARILKDDHAGQLDQEGKRYLDRVLDAANHMGHLVDDLLNLARIGRSAIVRQRIKLGDLVREAIAELGEEAQKRRIEWRIGSLPELECDPGLMKLVLVNLLSNAVKFTRHCQTAVIEVGTRDIEGATTLFVSDNGVGFDPKYADKLFGVFQRLHRQEEFEGTGIGLATVQRIIRRHGGEIWSDSELGRGATFFFTLGPRPVAAIAGNSKEAPLGRI